MIPQHFPGVTHIYKRNELQPDDIPIAQKKNTATSRWQPTYEELQALCDGGSIELTVHGGQPAVALRVV